MLGKLLYLWFFNIIVEGYRKKLIKDEGYGIKFMRKMVLVLKMFILEEFYGYIKFF